MTPVSFFTLGCASVIPQYEAAMARALAEPGPMPTTWSPDAVLHLSDDAINQVVQGAIEDYGTFSSSLDLMVVKITPDLELTSMEISAGNRCDDCLGIAIELGGELGWTSLLGEGTTPLAATGSLDARFGIERDASGNFAVTVQPTRFRFLDVTVGAITAGVSGIGESIQDWIDDNLVAAVPPQQVMEISQEDLPLLDVRMVPDGDSIQFHLLTKANDRGTVVADGPRPDTGWRLDLAPDSLIALARAEAFKADPASRGIVSEPTFLEMDEDSFTMGLRLWRTEGRGWWRDYVVNGIVAVDEDEIRLTATDVEQTAKSPGAAAADPLSALARGLILRFIEEAFETSLPTVQGEGLVVQIESIGAEEGALRVWGTMQEGLPMVPVETPLPDAPPPEAPPQPESTQ